MSMEVRGEGIKIDFHKKYNTISVKLNKWLLLINKIVQNFH